MSWYYDSNVYGGRFLQLGIWEEVNKSNNSSILHWSLTSAGGENNYYTVAPTTITINGVQVYHNDLMDYDATTAFPVSRGKVEGSLEVKHNDDGTKTCPISFTTAVFYWTPAERAVYPNNSITLTNISTYTLSLTATNSSITVNRTSSGAGSTVDLSNGARLYYGDKLKISFSPSKDYAISKRTVNGATFTSGNTHTVKGNVSVVSEAKRKRSLTISPDDGSTITVKRTSSSVGGTGNLSSGATIYDGDKLQISFSANSNYQLDSHTVNGSSFTSGNTHTVSGDVTVVATAIPLASVVSAANANIGSTTTLKVTRYNSGYYHTLQYTINGTTYYILGNGSVTTTATKIQDTSITFQIPNEVYRLIEGASGTFTITCKTYGNNTAGAAQIGNPTNCNITVFAVAEDCTPEVSGTVTDTNALSVGITEGMSLVRSVSEVSCQITASAKNYASISSATINGTPVALTEASGVYTGTLDIQTINSGEFIFSVTDSRGFSNSYTVTKDIINYVPVTCNPTIRPVQIQNPEPSTEMQLTISGNFWNGRFVEGDANYDNRLTVRYRYRKREADGTYGDFTSTKMILTPSVASFVYNAETSRYYTTEPLVLAPSNFPGEDSSQITPENFSYTNEYEFEIVAIDHLRSDLSRSNPITIDKKTIIVPKGVPLFDWGEHDFNFNIPVKIGGTGDSEIPSPVTINGYPMDYIVEQSMQTVGNGTAAEATWIYRKWHSGIAECWCSKTFSGVNFGEWGSWYNSGAIVGSSISYPMFDGVSIFIEKPVLNASLVSQGQYGYTGAIYAPSGTSNIPGSETAVASSKNVTGSFGISRGTSGSNNSYTINYHAIGIWKVNE